MQREYSTHFLAADHATEDLRAALNLSQSATRGNMYYQVGQRAGQVGGGQARDAKPRDGASFLASVVRVSRPSQPNTLTEIMYSSLNTMARDHDMITRINENPPHRMTD